MASPAGVKMAAQVPLGEVMRHSDVQDASSVVGVLGWTMKCRLKQTDPVGRPAAKLATLPPALVDG